jgi:hypothetical protein
MDAPGVEEKEGIRTAAALPVEPLCPITIDTYFAGMVFIKIRRRFGRYNPLGDH